MKKLMISMIALLALTACSLKEGKETEVTTMQTSETTTVESSTETETTTASEEVTLTVEELAAFNGKDGEKAYIAVNGVIYDVTDHPLWIDGQHNGYTAGLDLSEEITKSPHGEVVLKDLPVVGKLAQ